MDPVDTSVDVTPHTNALISGKSAVVLLISSGCLSLLVRRMFTARHLLDNRRLENTPRWAVDRLYPSWHTTGTFYTTLQNAVGGSVHFEWALPMFGGQLFLDNDHCESIMTVVNGNGFLASDSHIYIYSEVLSGLIFPQ